MEETEITDAEFEAGLQAVLGSHYEDLTLCSRRTEPVRRKERNWERVCWGALYGAILWLFLVMK